MFPNSKLILKFRIIIPHYILHQSKDAFTVCFQWQACKGEQVSLLFALALALLVHIKLNWLQR